MSSNPCRFALEGDCMSWEEMSWTETKQICNNLVHANVTESLTEGELHKFVEWLDKEYGPCKEIWTTLID